MLLCEYYVISYNGRAPATEATGSSSLRCCAQQDGTPELPVSARGVRAMPEEKVNPYAADAYWPGRPLLRAVFDNIKTEFLVTALVLVNMLGLLVDMAVTDAGCNIYENVTSIQACLTDHEDSEFIISWTDAFQWIELTFLVIFSLEICLRLYAYGYPYFFDTLNCIDAVIVFGLLILQILLVSAVDSSGASFNFLRIVRLVRLVRLFVVMNKVQKAQRAYKKAKYLKLGSPVERVMELLSEMKGRLEEEEDVADISWIMHLIVRVAHCCMPCGCCPPSQSRRRACPLHAIVPHSDYASHPTRVPSGRPLISCTRSIFARRAGQTSRPR